MYQSYKTQKTFKRYQSYRTPKRSNYRKMYDIFNIKKMVTSQTRYLIIVELQIFKLVNSD